MKKTLSLALVLVMLLSILAPVIANAQTDSEARAQELFNKAVVKFEPYKSLTVDEIKGFATQDVFTTLIYEIFKEEIKKHEELADKLGDGTELKAKIKELMTDDNITILLNEIKDGKAVESIAIIEKSIKSIEVLFDEKWENILNDDIKNSAKDIIDKVTDAVEPTIENQFTDIDNHWAKEDIMAMAKLGIVNGYPNGTFLPNGNITRAEFSKMIVSALDLETEIYLGGHSDVLVGDWHANHIATMVKNELAAGYPNGTFNPNGNITRNEMAMILAKVLKLEVNADTQEVILSIFKDMKLIPDWARNSVAQVVSAELMKGDTDSNFNPSNTATRAEAATVIFRLINK